MSTGEISTAKAANGMIEVPAYLQNLPADKTLMTELNKYSKVPFIKIVQGQTGEPFKPAFNDGDIIAFPHLIKIGDRSTPFTFTPLHFYTNFLAQNKFGFKPWIREQSYDETSDLAKKCKTFQKMADPDNPKNEITFRQALNFMVSVDHPELRDVFFALPFMGGEFKTGQNLIGLIQKRKTPYYFATRFRSASALHTSKDFKWWGLDPINDAEPYVSEDMFKQNMEIHGRIDELVKSRQLEVDYEIGGDGESSSSDAASEKKF